MSPLPGMATLLNQSRNLTRHLGSDRDWNPDMMPPVEGPEPMGPGIEAIPPEEAYAAMAAMESDMMPSQGDPMTPITNEALRGLMFGPRE